MGPAWDARLIAKNVSYQAAPIVLQLLHYYVHNAYKGITLTQSHNVKYARWKAVSNAPPIL